MKKAGKWPVVIKPIDYGLDFYGDLLFTRHSLLEQKPDLVEAFKQASLRGWKYALEHPQEIVSLIVAKYPTRGKEYDEQFLLYEAKVLQDYLEPSRREFIHARRYQQPLTMVIFDIDFFKIINDKHGHPGGDKVLIELARKTRPLLRESDMLARIGGEEFAVILPQTDASSVQSFYERLLKTNYDNGVEYQGATIRYSISIGVAQLDSNDQECEDLFRRCDKALYAAKQGGRTASLLSKALQKKQWLTPLAFR